MVLVGKSARLRPLTTADAEITLKWRKSERARFLQPGAQTPEEQRVWIASKEQAGELNFIIEYQGEPVGMIALLEINRRHKTASMGRLLIGEKEKVGTAPVAFEAELLLSDYAFDGLGMHKIYGDVMVDNIAMVKFRTYIGYTQEGVLREHYIYDGTHKNSILFSILENEYRNVCRLRLIQLIDLFDMPAGVERIDGQARTRNG